MYAMKDAHVYFAECTHILWRAHVYTTVKLQWLEHVWENGNLFEKCVVRANEI